MSDDLINNGNFTIDENGNISTKVIQRVFLGNNGDTTRASGANIVRTAMFGSDWETWSPSLTKASTLDSTTIVAGAISACQLF